MSAKLSETHEHSPLQGRKAFEALFTCRTLPQTFTRGGMKEDVGILQEKAEPQMVSEPAKYSDLMQAVAMTPPEIDGSVKCVMVTEDDGPNTNFIEDFRAEVDSHIARTCTSLSIKSRVRRSGFCPYKKPPVESKA